MRRLSVFNSVSVDGYFRSGDGDLSWAHGGQDDPEFRAFIAGNASGEGMLLFGRTTYEMMAGAWPSDEAHEQQPGMADVMARSPKIVFSKSLRDVEEGPRWQNVEIRRDCRGRRGGVQRARSRRRGRRAVRGSRRRVGRWFCGARRARSIRTSSRC